MDERDNTNTEMDGTLSGDTLPEQDGGPEGEPAAASGPEDGLAPSEEIAGADDTDGEEEPVAEESEVAEEPDQEPYPIEAAGDEPEPDEEPEPDAWYDHQLIGLAVIRNGERIGEVAHVDHLPAQDLLIVKTKRGDVMVPFVAAFVPEVDVEAGTLTVTPPPGLFEELPDEPEATAESGEAEASVAESAAGDDAAAASDETPGA